MIASAKQHGVIHETNDQTNNLDDLYEDYGPHRRFVSFEQQRDDLNVVVPKQEDKSFIRSAGKFAMAWEATIESNLRPQDIILWLVIACYAFLFFDFFIVLYKKLLS